MSDNKRYYWLKLKAGFFDEKTTKYLRVLPDGDKLVIVYLQMQLKSLTTNGLLKYDKLFPVVEEELALLLDEDVNIVKFTVQALIKANAASILDDGSIVLLAMKDLIGYETASAQRSREYRVNKSSKKALQCNNNATKVQHKTNVEKEKELELEKEKDIVGKTKRFSPPSLEEVNEYVKEKGYEIDSEYFIDYYTSNGWMAGRNKMKDWKAAIRNWAKRESNKKNPKETLMTKQQREDFEELLAIYPKKQRVDVAERVYLDAIKSGISHETIKNGVMSFAGYCKLSGLEYQFIPNMGTWFENKRWKDDYTVIEREPIKKKSRYETVNEKNNRAFAEFLKDEDLSDLPQVYEDCLKGLTEGFHV